MINHLHSSGQNYFTNSPLDRLSPHRPHINLEEVLKPDAPTSIVPVWRGKHFIAKKDSTQSVFLPVGDAQKLVQYSQQLVFLGENEGHNYFALKVTEEDPANNPFWQQRGEFVNIRHLNIPQVIGRTNGAIIAYARAMLHWHSNHLYCGRCGTATQNEWAGHMRICKNPDCKTKHFPRTDPAIITLITYGNQGLLVRQATWQPTNKYALVAGFVEPGESLEEAVQREVVEEVGLEVNHVQYQSSQPWPFPGSIMLGFRAEATHQNVELVDKEIEEFRWFTRTELKKAVAKEDIILSPVTSISRMLIDDWLQEE